MKKSKSDVTSVITLSHHPLLLKLLILILPVLLIGCEAGVDSESELMQEEEYNANPISIEFEKDSAMDLLGKSFMEISQVLGEPDEKGYSGRFGPHHYILYQSEEGFIQFSSPESLEDEIAVSIILGPGQEVLGAKVGMHFSEIVDILGTPDFGPEIGMDNLYYMDYFWGEINDQIPEVYVSFVAASINSPTDHAFIKWENFKSEEVLLLAAK